METSQGQSVQRQASANAQENPALADARSRLSQANWRLSQKESELKRLSPPTRFTDASGNTTVNPVSQREYDQKRRSLEREIDEARGEKLYWESRVNQLLLITS